MYGMDGNWAHIAQRCRERDMAPYVDNIKACLLSLSRRAKRRALPNCAWYIHVQKGREVVALVAGQGCYVSTVLSPTMVGRGQRLQ